jgi:hypothetical protein
MFHSISTPSIPRPTRRATGGPSGNPWLLWSVATPDEREILSVAEMSECRCPDFCDRDHANE